MDLFILHHGWAGKRLSSDSSDFGRPLTNSGKREVTNIAKSLKELGVQINFVITNPLKRAHQTASSWPSQGEQNGELGWVKTGT
jgi:phosphohistidine phosphatase